MKTMHCDHALAFAMRIAKLDCGKRTSEMSCTKVMTASRNLGCDLHTWIRL